MKHSTLFIDESGKSSLSKIVGEPFILTGVILDNEDISTVQGFFNYIKRKSNLDPATPFHSYDIFEDTSNKITDQQAKILSKTLSEFISLIPINIYILQINKSEFRKALGIRTDADFKKSPKTREMKEFPYKIMSAMLFKWFARYLQKNKAVGQIIVDSRRGMDDKLIKNLDACKDQSAGLLGVINSKLVAERLTAICFAQKTFLSGGLEITDLISYTSFFHAKRKMASMRTVNLHLTWVEIKNKLKGKKIDNIRKTRIRNFFKVGEDGIHEYLK